jgi:hypothetical protein
MRSAREITTLGRIRNRISRIRIDPLKISERLTKKNLTPHIFLFSQFSYNA